MNQNSPRADNAIEDLKNRLDIGHIGPCEFLDNVTSLGLSIPAAYAFVTEVTGEKFPQEVLAQSLPTESVIRERMEELQKYITNEHFLSLLADLKGLPPDLRMQEAARLATP